MLTVCAAAAGIVGTWLFTRQANRKTSNDTKVLESLQLALFRIEQDGNLKDAKPFLGDTGLYHVEWSRTVPTETIILRDSVSAA